MKKYQGKINQLKENQIFVFGSNPVSIQGAGAALFCVKRGWCTSNEKMNNCLSISGKAWGIVTVSYPGKKRSKTSQEISLNIKKLYDYAEVNPNMEFLIAYTGLNSYNLNGYTNSEIADMFSTYSIPDNIIFEEEFSTLLKK
jgi:hypothetical protein